MHEMVCEWSIRALNTPIWQETTLDRLGKALGPRKGPKRDKKGPIRPRPAQGGPGPTVVMPLLRPFWTPTLKMNPTPRATLLMQAMDPATTHLRQTNSPKKKRNAGPHMCSHKDCTYGHDGTKNYQQAQAHVIAKKDHDGAKAIPCKK